MRDENKIRNMRGGKAMEGLIVFICQGFTEDQDKEKDKDS